MSAKKDLLKDIEKAVKRKKTIAAEVARKKTIANHVSNFFQEIREIQGLDLTGYLDHLALNKLQLLIQRIDCAAVVRYKPDPQDPHVEITWSKQFAEANTCEQVSTLTESGAIFEETMENL